MAHIEQGKRMLEKPEAYENLVTTGIYEAIL